jgi:hypothetical protein
MRKWFIDHLLPSLLSQLIVTAVVAIGVGVWAVAAQIPLPIVVVLVLGTIAATIVIWERVFPASYNRVIGPRPRRTDNLPASDAKTFVVERDVLLYDAIIRMFTGDWDRPIPLDREIFDLDREGFERLGDLVISTVRQLAYDGRLTVWGRQYATGVLKVIPKEFWEHGAVDWFDFLRREPREMVAKVEGAHATAWGPPWKELMVSKAQVEAICASPAWPIHGASAPRS